MDFCSLSTEPLDSSWLEAADTIPALLWAAAPDGRIAFVNRRWEAATGLDAACIIAAGWPILVTAPDAARIAEAFRAQLSCAHLQFDVRLRRADGSYGWSRLQADALRDSTGHVLRWIGIVVEIDDVYRSAADFRTLAESVPAIVWTADRTGSIDWYNHRWYDYTGQTVEEALGWGWQVAHHPSDFVEVMRAWPHSIATGKSFEMELRLRRYDGSFHWFLTRIEPVRDAGGTVLRWYGSHVDIDAQKSALDRTMRVAQTFQEAFLPRRLPQHDQLRIDAIYLPAEKEALIGGDWFDAFETRDGSIAISIGDVIGHGLEASVAVGRLRQAIFTLAFRMDDPAEILTELDRIVRFQDAGTMATALLGFVDAQHTTLTYAGAGHPPPLIAYRGDPLARLLPLSGLPLGTGFPFDTRTYTVPIERDAVVAFYTDGMIEFSRDILDAENKLRAAVALFVGDTSVARPALAIQEIVFNDMPSRDDAALLLLQFSPIKRPELEAGRGALEMNWRFHSSDAHAAHESRREITAYLQQHADDPDQLQTAELVVGEILANTVKHAPGLVEIYIDWRKQHPVILVHDTGAGLTRLPTQLPADALSEDGRGLYLVEKLTEQVTVRRRPGYGTEIRAVLALDRRR